MDERDYRGNCQSYKLVSGKVWQREDKWEKKLSRRENKVGQSKTIW